MAVGVAVVVDGGKGGGGCGRGCSDGVGGEGGGQGGRKGGGRGVLIFDLLLRSLHFVQTIILIILPVSQLGTSFATMCVFFLYLLPLLGREASQPHPFFAMMCFF
jgi:hypothetical protein